MMIRRSVSQPTVSVVINTLNRAAWLGDAISGLKGLEYPLVEVVVVNGPSTDGTEEVLSKWAGKVKLGSCSEANLSVSRNVGISLAAGDIIAFIDDDAVPHPKWISRLVDGFSDPAVGAVGGFTIDNTGVRWQVRKTICDRYGNAFNVSDLFDERPLCRPGTAYYPSLLGTNSAFRASALRGIGGFDHTFAYLLDETDVCLRLVDAGWRVVYEPDAMVYHQFAPSHIRSRNRVARTLYPSAVSKSYFIMRHGSQVSQSEAFNQLTRYREEIYSSNAWLHHEGMISDHHRFSLDQDIALGTERGVEIARTRTQACGDLSDTSPPPFLPFDEERGIRIAFVTQGYPPKNDAGIARWTAMAAEGLARRGHHVHVITQTDGDESVEYRDGLWMHRLRPDPEGGLMVENNFDVPPNISQWTARVWREMQHLKSFGLDVLSFPIWDLEGLASLDDPDLTVVVSLHTTYAMAKPFKPEWSVRPLFEHFVVNRVIAAEKMVLSRAPMLLANSDAVIRTIEELYHIDVRDRCMLVPHGTEDPLTRHGERAAERERQLAAGSPLRVLYVGRFEPRKGFDIAFDVAMKLAQESTDIEMWFVGDTINEHVEQMKPEFAAFASHPRLRFLGKLDRQEVEEAFVDCDLILTPSRFESFGLVGIEALASGRPVLTLAGSGLAEVVEDGVTGAVWAESEDIADLIASEIRRLNSARGDLANMSREARAAYERKYQVEVMIDRLEAAYQRAHHGVMAEAAE